MEQVNKKRDISIDIVKGIGIILVVFSHLTFQGEIQRNLVHAFHMPLFFLVSGFLYKSKPIKEVLKKGTKAYLLPAYVMLVVDIIIAIIRNKISLDSGDLLKTLILSGRNDD